MTISINYKNGSSKKNSTNLVLFLEEKLNISNIRKYISGSEYTFISDINEYSESEIYFLIFEMFNFSSKNRIRFVEFFLDEPFL